MVDLSRSLWALYKEWSPSFSFFSFVTHMLLPLGNIPLAHVSPLVSKLERTRVFTLLFEDTFGVSLFINRGVSPM